MVTELIGAADGGASAEEDTMHQVPMRAAALQYTRQHQAQTAAEQGRLLDPRPARSRRSLRSLLPLARPAVTGRRPARQAQARRSSAAAAKI